MAREDRVVSGACAERPGADGEPYALAIPLLDLGLGVDGLVDGDVDQVERRHLVGASRSGARIVVGQIRVVPREDARDFLVGGIGTQRVRRSEGGAGEAGAVQGQLRGAVEKRPAPPEQEGEERESEPGQPGDKRDAGRATKHQEHEANAGQEGPPRQYPLQPLVTDHRSIPRDGLVQVQDDPGYRGPRRQRRRPASAARTERTEPVHRGRFGR